MEIESLKKKSKQGARISLVGFLIVIATFFFAGFQLNQLSSKIKLKNRELETKNNELIALDSVIKSSKQEIIDKQILIDTLVQEINRLRDPSIQPKTNAVKIPGVYHLNDKNYPLYDFTLWVYSSNHTLNKIDKVEYEFNHHSYLMNIRESSERSNNFLVSYRGWGCMSTVEVRVHYKDGRKEKLYFPMCDDLGW